MIWKAERGVRPVYGKCWLHTGYCENGYGRVGLGRIHRVVFIEFGGEIPEGFTLDHLCRIKNCYRPNHLEPVPLAENIRRGLTRTHCRRGHLLAGDNLIHLKNGKRRCRACMLEYGLVSRRRKGAGTKSEAAHKRTREQGRFTKENS